MPSAHDLDYDDLTHLDIPNLNVSDELDALNNATMVKYDNLRWLVWLCSRRDDWGSGFTNTVRVVSNLRGRFTLPNQCLTWSTSIHGLLLLSKAIENTATLLWQTAMACQHAQAKGISAPQKLRLPTFALSIM